MVKKSRRWGGPRPAPYNPNARDADRDGMVQEGTIWERPGGTRFVNRLGQEIAAAAAAVTPGSYIADERGNRVDYTPTWQQGAPGDVDLSPAGGLPKLGDIGMPSIGETHGTIRDTVGTVEGPPEVPDLKPDPRDVEQPGPDGVSLPDGRKETFQAEISALSGQEIHERRQRLAKELTEGALQGSNWTRTDGRPTGDGPGPEFAVEPIATFRLDEAAEERIEALGGTAFPLYELASDAEGAQEFQDAVRYAHDTHKFGTSVDVYDVIDYQGDIRLFLSPDKKVGFAVKGDGQLVSVFNADDDVEMPLHTMIPLAISQGATRADAFDTVLPGFYAQFGLQPVSRLDWSHEYRPFGWDYPLYSKFNNGRPDVVFMRFDPERVGEPYVPGDGFRVHQYDDGLASTEAVPDIPMDVPEPIPEVPEIDAIPGIDRAEIVARIEAEIRKHEDITIRGIDVYPEEVADKDGVYDAVRSLVADPPDPDGNWVFTGSKAVIDDHGDEAEEALTAYIQNSLSINNSLRDDSVSPENQKVVDTFDALFEALPPSEGGVVYRGAPMRTLLGETDGIETEDELDALIEETIGTVIADDGILSTSSLPEVAVDFSMANRSSTDPEGYLVLEIDIPEGGEALGISQYPGRGESEVLLPRGIEYEVTGVKKVRREGDHPTYVVKVAQKQRSNSVAEEAVTEAPKMDVIEGETPFISDVLGRGGSKYSLKPVADSAMKEAGLSGKMNPHVAVSKYTQGGWADVNQRLRAGEIADTDAEAIEALDRAIELAVLDEPYTTFRGLTANSLLGDVESADVEDALSGLIGETISDPAFLSTSLSPHRAEDFALKTKKGEAKDLSAPVMLRINVPEGTGGLYVTSRFQEDEVILPRDSGLRVTGATVVRTPRGVEYGGGPAYILDVEVVPREGAGQALSRTADDVAADIAAAIEEKEVV